MLRTYGSRPAYTRPQSTVKRSLMEGAGCNPIHAGGSFLSIVGRSGHLPETRQMRRYATTGAPKGGAIPAPCSRAASLAESGFPVSRSDPPCISASGVIW
jgi:hypothetical protein